MFLNTLRPAPGSKKSPKRLGRGIGSGLGKTSGRGHKGQHARSGGYHKVGFEGGQMPLQRRLPKGGFQSRKNRYNGEIRLHELNKLEQSEIDLLTLKQAGLVSELADRAKVILAGEIKRAVTLKSGVFATKGARAAIEAAGGGVEA